MTRRGGGLRRRPRPVCFPRATRAGPVAAARDRQFREPSNDESHLQGGVVAATPCRRMTCWARGTRLANPITALAVASLIGLPPRMIPFSIVDAEPTIHPRRWVSVCVGGCVWVWVWVDGNVLCVLWLLTSYFFCKTDHSLNPRSLVCLLTIVGHSDRSRFSPPRSRLRHAAGTRATPSLRPRSTTRSICGVSVGGARYFSSSPSGNGAPSTELKDRGALPRHGFSTFRDPAKGGKGWL